MELRHFRGVNDGKDQRGQELRDREKWVTDEYLRRRDRTFFYSVYVDLLLFYDCKIPLLMKYATALCLVNSFFKVFVALLRT